MTEPLHISLRNISIIWSILHIIILFSFLYQPKISRKKATLITLFYMIPLGVANMGLLAALNSLSAIKYMLMLVTVASLVFFSFLSTYRGARFVFTFCMADTAVLIVLILTAMADVYLFNDSGLFRLISRLIIFPVLEYLTWKYFRRIYNHSYEIMATGWGWFAWLGVFCYCLLIFMMIYPESILTNPDHIPAMLLCCTLIPMVYYAIVRSLRNQHRLHRLSSQEAILRLERDHMEDIIRQNMTAEERIRIERHDLRHRMKTLLSMLERGAVEETIAYLNTSIDALDNYKVTRYCQNPIVDAVFSAFFADARANDIRIESSLAVPHDLPVDATEFSIVMANALENAIHACLVLPKEQREIRCKYVIGPRHICQISNPVAKPVKLDENGHPYSREPGHGIGTQSIVAFCEKYGADLHYKYEDGWFHIRIIL
jgi:hypothetical protein